MNQTVYTQVIRRFLTVYGTPNVPVPDDLYAEFSKALKDYASPIIEAAVDRLIADHAYPSWPTVGEVVKAVRSEAARRSRPQVYAEEPSSCRRPLTPEESARAREIYSQAVAALSAAKLEDICKGAPVDISRAEFERRAGERAKRLTGGAA